MTQKVILVVGLSGVGKTTMIKAFVNKNEGYVFVTASSLLAQKTKTEDTDALRRGSTDNIVHNQQHIVRAFAEYRAANVKSNIIIDGHVIIDNDQGIVEVPYHVIAALNPDKVIVIVSEPEDIISRRKNDENRIRPDRTKLGVHQQQTLSLRKANEYSKKLKCPFIQVSSGNIEFFTQSIKT